MSAIHQAVAALFLSVSALVTPVPIPEPKPPQKPPAMPIPRPDNGYVEASMAGVDVALILAVDVSQSMDEGEQAFQREGYISGIMSPEFASAVRQGAYGKIAMTYIEWGGEGFQSVVVDWTIIETEADAARFTAALAANPISTSQRTSIAAGLKFAAARFPLLPLPADRYVIDVSGDGPNNQGGSVEAARDALVASGITINGLPLKVKSSVDFGYVDVEHYYEDCVIGGAGSFVVKVGEAGGFTEAIKRKLIMEIAGVTPIIQHVAARQSVPCSTFD